VSLQFTTASRIRLYNNSRHLEVRGEILPGEVVGLRGPSGCGKSTFLRELAQVGENPFLCELDGQEISSYSPEERRVSLVFQKALLFPHLNVMENIRFPLRFHAPYRSWTRELQQARVEEYLGFLSLSALSQRSPSTLSGGEAMRVALLRAVVSTPRCLLLDEAFSALDKDTKVHAKSWLKDFIKDHRIPTLLVAHVAEDLENFADRCVDWPHASAPLQF
jgi:ABC-type Fe3+/spermidine/putrescine transport system ATPase subunit